MKMLKKLLAVVLTGAMALTLLTACGGNAVTEKGIADAMNDMAKATGGDVADVTFTPGAKERELARKIVALVDSVRANGSTDSSTELSAKIDEILGINDGGVNEKSRYVWVETALADGIGAAGQAHQIMEGILSTDAARNKEKLGGKNPANDRCMGTALFKGTDLTTGKPVTMRVIVVTAKAEG